VESNQGKKARNARNFKPLQAMQPTPAQIQSLLHPIESFKNNLC